jgi:ABC-type antimicrobial peptide transport system permease subunit
VGDVYLPRGLLHDTVNPPVTAPYIPWIKLKPHVSPAVADAELNAIVRQFAKENPNHFPEKWHLQLQPIIVPYQQNTSRTPDQQIANGTFTLNEAIERDAQYSRQRLFSILFGVFSAMALVLALVGIFSVVAYSVAQRTTEFGVRLALGAPRSHVLWVAARIALVSTAAGIAIGLALDSFLGAILAHWMHSAFAAWSLLLPAALLTLSALLACALPARRATAVPPAEALRYE